MKPLKKKANDVNDSIWIPGRVASGRGGSGASSVVIQRNPSQINRHHGAEEEERSEEQDPNKDVECTHHAKTWKANQRHKRDEKSKPGCDGTSRDKMEGGGRRETSLAKE